MILGVTPGAQSNHPPSPGLARMASRTENAMAGQKATRRDLLLEEGIALEDGADGTTWRRN